MSTPKHWDGSIMLLIETNALKNYIARAEAAESALAQEKKEREIQAKTEERIVSRLIARAESAEAKLAAIIPIVDECRVIHQGYPKDWDCIDIRDDARSGHGNYAPEWRAKVAAGEGMCSHCQVKALAQIEQQPANAIADMKTLEAVLALIEECGDVDVVRWQVQGALATGKLPSIPDSDAQIEQPEAKER
jgi:hypothetical protein